SLPAYREIVFDEAHTLEHVATDHLACEITPRRVYRLMTRLFRTKQGASAGKGLLPSLLFQLEQARGTFDEPLFGSIHQHVLEAIAAVNAAQSGADVFFDAVRHWFENVSRQVDDDEADAPFVPRERG